jgi:hypothetical protein
MSSVALELEAMPEYEEEYEYEAAAEWEGEDEGEEFLRRLGGMARRAFDPARLRRLGLAAARAAAGAAGNLGAAYGGASGTAGARTGGYVGATLGRLFTDLLDRGQGRQAEFEWEANPIRRVYPDALMEHLGHRASQTESEAEAEEFMAALVPLAARLAARAAPGVGPAVMRAAPRLAQGVVGITRTLRASPSTRPLVQTVPGIVRRTTATLARQAATGRPVTPQRAAATLARQTARTLTSPQQCQAAIRRARAMDRAFHRQAATVARG